MAHNLQDTLMKVTSSNSEKNKKIIIKEFGTLYYKDEKGNSLYHLIIACHTAFSSKTFAIETLLKYDIDPNQVNNDGDTFIHYALKKGIDIVDIIFILKEALKYGYDINIKNNCEYTLLHSAILFIKSQEFLLKFAYTLITSGLDTKTVDSGGESLIDFIEAQDHLTVLTKDGLKRMITTNCKDYKDSAASKKIPSSNKYGTFLNDKNYENNPAIGRDKEVNKLIISLATDKKLPLLVGPSGVGKTTVIDEFTYRIIKGNVPHFLKDKLIYEVHMSSILAGTKYRGDMEKNMKEVIDFTLKNKAILFIDEFHMVFGAGASENDKSDVASILKAYIDRHGLKVIGATTDYEYEEYMANDALKRRFEIIRVKELDNDKLYDIAINTIDNLVENKQLVLSNSFSKYMDQIINILLILTKNNNRRYDDKIYNPDLLISLIDRAFAYALVEEDNELDIKHLILSIEDSDRLYDYAKEVAIHNLNNLETKTLVRNKIIDLNEYKKEHSYV